MWWLVDSGFAPQKMTTFESANSSGSVCGIDPAT
jgi:hypothetical protein